MKSQRICDCHTVVETRAERNMISSWDTNRLLDGRKDEEQPSRLFKRREDSMSQAKLARKQDIAGTQNETYNIGIRIVLRWSLVVVLSFGSTLTMDTKVMKSQRICDCHTVVETRAE